MPAGSVNVKVGQPLFVLLGSFRWAGTPGFKEKAQHVIYSVDTKGQLLPTKDANADRESRKQRQKRQRQTQKELSQNKAFP